MFIMSRVWFVVCFAVVFSAAGGQEFASDCPERNGFFADAYQCDKYYACVDGILTERLCPDGMVFDDLNPLAEKCDFPFHVDCAERPELQPAKPSKNCPRKNGYFPHEDPSVCNEFFFCSGGTGSRVTCPESLVFSLKTGTCVWPDDAGRADCSPDEVLNFTCPKEPADIAVAHPRYPDPVDCQYFYVCINGENPRKNGCKFGEVFNSETKACDEPRNVPECKDYYREYFEQFFSNEGKGGNGNIANIDILAAAIASGYDIPDRPARVKINPGSASRRRPVDTPASAAEPPAISREPVRTRAPLPRTSSSPTSPVEEAPRRAPPSRTTQSRRPPTRSQTEGETTKPLRRPLRRRPLRNQAPTTTTTTTPKPVEKSPIDYEYYYYDDTLPAPSS